MPARGGSTTFPGGPIAVGDRATPFLDEGRARELGLGETIEVLHDAADSSGRRRVTRRPWVRDAAATVRAVASLEGEHADVPWRWTQVLSPDGGAWAGLRVVIDWRDSTALACEVVGPTPVRVRRELALLDELHGPHRRTAPLQVLAHLLLWGAGLAAIWLSAMRELQSTPTSHAVAVAMWLALTAGTGLLAVHLAVRAVPPRRLALQPARARAALGWAWLPLATVFVLRPPWEPYVEWRPGWVLAAIASGGYALLCLPRRRRAERPAPGPLMEEVPGGPDAVAALVRPPVPPDTVRAHGEAVAAYWRTPIRLRPAEERWNVTEHTWDSPAGTVTALAFQAWDAAPVHVVLARAFDRTLMVRSVGDALRPARELTDAWFGPGGPIVRAGAPAPRAPGWAVPAVLGWLCLLTFAVGSDLGPSTYEWLWPVDFQVEHDYPILAAACVAGVVLAYAWAVASLVGLARTPAGPRERRRRGRVLAWQLAAAWLSALVLTMTVAPRFAEGTWVATATTVVAVANLGALLVALGVVVGIRPDSPLGGTLDAPRRAARRTAP